MSEGSRFPAAWRYVTSGKPAPKCYMGLFVAATFCSAALRSPAELRDLAREMVPGR